MQPWVRHPCLNPHAPAPWPWDLGRPPHLPLHLNFCGPGIPHLSSRCDHGSLYLMLQRERGFRRKAYQWCFLFLSPYEWPLSLEALVSAWRMVYYHPRMPAAEVSSVLLDCQPSHLRRIQALPQRAQGATVSQQPQPAAWYLGKEVVGSGLY